MEYTAYNSDVIIDKLIRQLGNSKVLHLCIMLWYAVAINYMKTGEFIFDVNYTN